MDKLKILSPGGRIKGAYIGMEHLSNVDPVELNTKTIPSLRKNRGENLPEGLLGRYKEAFFPRREDQFRQIMGDLGIYRPTIKNDQGMAGQFLPFGVSLETTETDLTPRQVIRNEGIAIPEPYSEHDPAVVRMIQEGFLNFDFSRVNELMLKNYSNMQRRAGKGRLPYFFIRPGMLDRNLVFGKDVLDSVQKKVTDAIEELTRRTANEEIELTGSAMPIRLIYGQADVFINNRREVTVGEIQTPDVGLFLNSFEVEGSQILPEVQKITTKLESQVLQSIAETVKNKKLYLVTRDEVLDNQEDVLEINELTRMAQGLTNLGLEVQIISVSQVGELEEGSELILLNIDYSDPKTQTLIKKHLSGQICCYPNPIFQKNSKTFFGGQEIIIEQEYRKRYLKLIQPKTRMDEKSILPTLAQIHKPLKKAEKKEDGEISPIYHAQIGNKETVPVLTNSIHSLGQLHTRVHKYGPEDTIVLRVMPFNPEESIIRTKYGPLFHSFRFMFISGIR
jgi:hypothetical protein